MERKPVTLRLTDEEANTFDRGGLHKTELRSEYDNRAIVILDGGDVSSVTVTHPAGYVAWYYEARRPAFGWFA